MAFEDGLLGRLDRIERTLDKFVGDMGDFREETATRLTRLETASGIRETQHQEKVSSRAYRTMWIGIIASFGVGIAGLILRVFGVGL